MIRKRIFLGQRLPTQHKLRLLRAAVLLRRGRLVAQQTGTVPGVAASPFSRAGIERLGRFKQRRGPFLLLADSHATAMRLTVQLPPELRRTMQGNWPGACTLALPAAGNPVRRIAPDCLSGRSIAVRVDADIACRYLAHLTGGLLASSSLNRKGGPGHRPTRQLRMRWHRHLSACMGFGEGTGQASALYRWTGSHLLPLRLPVSAR